MELKSASTCSQAAFSGSNRTFMELKFAVISISFALQVCRSNRTFMELKLILYIYIIVRYVVLIAPLWN